MKNFAELKRALQVGTKIKTLENNHGKFIGEISTISKVQTNGFYIDRNGNNSWLEYPKAMQVTIEDDNIFSFNVGSFVVKYQIVTNNEKDYNGEFGRYQRQLDNAGVDFDITDLSGCTQSEIQNFVYSKTHFRCKNCNAITLKIKDKVGKATEWHCEDCNDKKITNNIFIIIIKEEDK